MFEELILKEKDNFQHFLEDADYYQIVDIINNNNFPKYFRDYLNGYLFDQLYKLKTDIIYNYGIKVDDLEFADNWRLFEESCYNFYKLNKSKLNEFVLNSIQLNFNLIIRPKQTLVNFLFRDEIYQVSDIIKNRLEYFNSEQEIISELKIWLSDQNQVISIFHFRNTVHSLLNKLFKENHFDKVAEWFSYLSTIIEQTKFNAEHSVYTILSIFSNDLYWNGLQQYLNENKQQFVSKALSDKTINEVLLGYLAQWHKESEAIPKEIQQTESIPQIESFQDEITNQDLSKIEETPTETDEYNNMILEEAFEGEGETYATIELEQTKEEPLIDIADFESIAKQAQETPTETDEYDNMILEEAFEGEGETYDIKSNELEGIETNENLDENIWNFSNDLVRTDVSTIDEDLEHIDEIMAEIESQEHSLIEQSDQAELSTTKSEDEELERLAEIISSKTDIAASPSISQSQTTNEPTINPDNTSSIETYINSLTNKLDQKITNQVEIKSYEELANQVNLQDLNYIDLNDPQIPQTKKELYQLMLDLKRKQYNF